MTQTGLENPDLASQSSPASDDLEALTRVLSLRGFERVRRFGVARFEGTWMDRDWAIKFSSQSRTRYAGDVRYRQRLGFRIRIDATTSVLTRFYFLTKGVVSVGFVRFVHRLRKYSALEPLSSLPDYLAVAREPAWAHALLENPDVIAAAQHLLVDPPGRVASSVYLEPGSLHYAGSILPRQEITPEAVLEILDHLARFADAAENAPAPKIVCKLSFLGRLVKRRKRA